MRRPRAAVIGLAGAGEEYLSALRDDGGYELVAIADVNPELLRRHADDASIRLYEDYRSLIVERSSTGLDIMFVTLEPFQSLEFMDLTASHGINVFHKAPFARSVEEARRLAALFDANGCKLLVSRTWQYEHAFSGLTGASELVKRVDVVTATVQTTDRPSGWRGDCRRAGGGVLLNGAYEQLDMIVSLLGVPESVHAHCSAIVAPGAVRNYDTEDAALLLLDFRDQRVGSLTAWRGAPRAGWNATLVAAEATIELCDDRMTVLHAEVDGASDTAPRNARRRRSPTGTRGALATMVGAVRDGMSAGTCSHSSSAADHLNTLAVIEAAYLSAKTASPEAAAQFLS